MKILKEAPYRIRKLNIYFKFYKEDDMLLRHIDFFSCLKVEEQTEFNTVCEAKVRSRSSKGV